MAMLLKEEDFGFIWKLLFFFLHGHVPKKSLFYFNAKFKNTHNFGE